MRASRRVNATVLATTVMSLLFAFACSGGDEPTSVTAPPQAPDAAAAAQPDGGDAAISESSIPQTTAEPPPAPVGAKLLVGGDVFLLGTTNDGFALYIANSYGDGPLYAVSLAGGAPIQLAPFVHFSDVIIQGNGVAFWTGVALNPLRGTLNLWTQATGLRPNLGMTVADAAYFSDDGSRVAFFVNPRPLASPPRVDLAVTNVAAPSLAPVISDLNQDPDTDLAPTCTPHLRYVGPLLYTAYCTVDRPLQSVFRAVSAAGVVTTIIDNTIPANGVQSDFSLDATAQKAFFVGTNREARVLTMANGSTTVLDTNVVSGTGIISADGSTALYVKEIPPVRRTSRTSRCAARRPPRRARSRCTTPSGACSRAPRALRRRSSQCRACYPMGAPTSTSSIRSPHRARRRRSLRSPRRRRSASRRMGPSCSTCLTSAGAAGKERSWSGTSPQAPNGP